MAAPPSALADRFAAFVTSRPWVVLGIALAVGAGSFPAAAKLRFGGAFTDLFPDTSGPSRAYADFMKRFEADRTLAVVLSGEDPATLEEFATRFADRCQGDPEVESVVRGVDLKAVAHLSPAEVFARAGPETFPRLAPRLDPAGLDRAVLELKAALTGPVSPPRELLLGDPLGLARALFEGLDGAQAPVDPLDGTFRSPDGRARLVILRPRGVSADIGYSERLLETLDGHAAAARAGLPGAESLRAGYTGSYAYVVGYWNSIQRDMTWLSALSLVGILGLYYLLMRRLRAAALTALGIVVAVPPTLAVAGVLFGGFNQISAAAAAIVFGLGIDAGIHLFSRYGEECRELSRDGPPDATVRRRAMRSALAHLLPVTATGAGATALILCALGISRFRGLSELGLLTAAGLVLTVLSMLTVLPALLLVAGGAPPPPLELRIERHLARIATHRPIILGACALVVLSAVLLFPRLRIEDDPLTIVAGKTPAEMVQRELEDRFGVRYRGALLLVARPTLEEALRANDLLYRELLALRARGLAGSIDSLAPLWPAAETRTENLARFAALDLAAVAARAREALLAAEFRLAPFEAYLSALATAAAAPGPAPGAAELEAASFALQYVRRAGDPGVAPTGGWLVATWIYPPAGTDRAGEEALLPVLDALAAARGAQLTGYPALRAEFSRLLSADAGWILALCGAAVAAAVLLHLRRGKAVLATLLPLGVAFCAFAAALAAAGVPLSLFTFPVLPLVFGLGFDEHLYLADRYLAEGDVERALRGSVRPILLTVLTDAIAFGVLAFADFSALRDLGITAAFGVMACLASALLVMPSLLLWISPPTPK